MKTLLRILTLAMFVVGVALPDTASANFTFFRNYPDLQWKVIKTEHFNVFYPVSRDEKTEHPVDAEFAARKTAYVAEEMYPLICGQFNYYLDETVNIVILDHNDDLEGYTIPNFDWIVVSARWSDDLWRLRGHHDWLRVVLYHEFAHVVSLKADQTFAEESFGSVIGVNWGDGRINTQAGASVFFGTGDPWFWVEGGAEYYTGVAGINNWTSNRDMRIRMDALEGLIMDLDEAGDYFGMNDGFDGERHYQGGYAFALYLEERFGQGVYQGFAQKRSEQGWTPDWNSVIEETLAIPAKQLYEDFRTWAREKYEKVEARVHADHHEGKVLATEQYHWMSDKPEDREQTEWLKTIGGRDKYKWRRERTKDGMYNYAPRMSADGKRVGLLKGNGLAVANTTEGTFLPLANDPEERWAGDAASGLWPEKPRFDLIAPAGFLVSDGQYDFSPDGSKIAFACTEDTKDAPGSKSEAAWKASKKVPPLVDDWDGYHRHALCVLDYAALWQEAEAQYKKFWKDKDPMEEDRVAWEKARRGIKVKAPKEEKGKKAKRHVSDWFDEVLPKKYITIHPSEIRIQDPAWSPDGTKLVMSRYEDGNQDLWIFDVATGTSTQLTKFDDGTQLEGTDWSPDGKQIVYGAFRWNQSDLYVVQADGTNNRPLTMDKYEDREPHWAHDGNIYFGSDREGGIFNIFRLNPRIDPSKPDKDLDGIADGADKCPAEPETANLYRDQDGCPDGVPVRMTQEKIEIDEKVQFALDDARILEDSYDLLDAVARTMVEHPELLAVEIGGHADAQGDPAANLDLSQRRSNSVLDYLAGKGVDRARLSAMGYGSTRPIRAETNEEAYATNRRVEFVIKARERASTDKVVAPTAPASCSAITNAGGLGNAYVTQVTNVVGGAFWPWVTPEGNLLYSNYLAFGFKYYGLPCGEWMGKVIDPTPFVITKDSWGTDKPQERFPSYEEVTEDVNGSLGYARNPMLIPIINLSATSLSHLGVDFGAYFNTSDVLDKHEVSIFTTAGEDLTLWGRYDNRLTNVPFYLGGMLRSIKFDYGFNLDEDGSTVTTDDQFLGDLKQGYLFYGGFAGLQVPFRPGVNLDISTFQYGLSIAGTDNGKRFDPIYYRGRQDVSLTIGRYENPRSLSIPINVRGGRSIVFGWSPNYSVPLNQASGGSDFDDGQEFQSYFFNEFTANYIEYIPLPFKSKKSGEDLLHTLELELQLGMIDRNVPYGDEMKAGGAGGGNVRNAYASNNLFAGYPGFSLSGESLAIVGLRYRFPLAAQIDKKVGPVYFESVYLQFFATVGNLWSYKLRGDVVADEGLFGELVTPDERDRKGGELERAGSTIQREWFGTGNSENGNHILADVGVELRVAANMFNRSPWFSFARIAYGFMPIQGRGDVDGDDVYTNSSDPALENRSDEIELAAPRFYLGIGTGW